jgi:hypothetical protein
MAKSREQIARNIEHEAWSKEQRAKKFMNSSNMFQMAKQKF